MYGDQGLAWLRSLDEKIASLKKRWKFEIHTPFQSSYNYVAPVFLPDRGHAVLKVCISKTEFEREITALDLIWA